MTPKLSGLDDYPLLFRTVSVHQRFSQGTAGVACLCSVPPGVSDGKLKGWVLKSSKGSQLSYLVIDVGC